MVHVGDIGCQIVLDIERDLNTATLKKIKFQRPDGITGEWDAVLFDTTKMGYVTIAETDLDQHGVWQFQPYAEFTNWKGHGKIISISVDPIIVLPVG